MTITLLTEADIPRAVELKDAIGWNQTSRDWRRFLRLTPQGCFKAVTEGDVTGTAAAFVIDGVGWISMVVVKRELRRRGIGKLLMERSLQFCDERGMPIVKLDATQEGLPLYRSVGFHEEYRITSARIGIDEIPRHFQENNEAIALREITPDDIPALTMLDREACGLGRADLLEELLTDYPGLGFVTDYRTCSGYVLFRPGSLDMEIGPLIADDRLVADALLGRVLDRIKGERGKLGIRSTVSLQNPAAVGLFQRRGFTCIPRLTRMFRGTNMLHTDSNLIYSYSGPEKG
jgi:ribosomal protein S18 acetylase RimI-like enzyme